MIFISNLVSWEALLVIVYVLVVRTFVKRFIPPASRDILEKASFYPEVGDIIKWDNEFYELDNVDANQYFSGKNPDTWPNGDKFGYSISVLCDAHVTRQTPLNIRKMRVGVTDDNQSYKGF